MRLHSLHLQQFRNYASHELDLRGSDRHIFLGPNGSGKTNILEAISVLSLTKSGLGVEEEHLLQWGSEFWRVKGTAQNDGGESVLLEVVSQMTPRRQKACFVNDVKIGLSQMVGRLPMILFLPQDLQLFSGPPAERRRFIDQLLSQVSPQYLQALMEYQKALKQRNALLKLIAQGSSGRESLDVWEGQLAETGAVITLARLELMEAFSLSLLDELTTLGETWKDVKLTYDRASEAHEQEGISVDLKEAFRTSRDRDLILQSTCVGPHREDWMISVEGHALTAFASRGQQRVSVLALLFLQASFVELRRGERPVILLDDVFSELDDAHQDGVLKAFADYQVFITGTHLPKKLDGATLWEVEEGQIKMLNAKF